MATPTAPTVLNFWYCLFEIVGQTKLHKDTRPIRRRYYSLKYGDLHIPYAYQTYNSVWHNNHDIHKMGQTLEAKSILTYCSVPMSHVSLRILSCIYKQDSHDTSCTSVHVTWISMIRHEWQFKVFVLLNIVLQYCNSTWNTCIIYSRYYYIILYI